MSENNQGDAGEYSDKGFWTKVIAHAKVAGKELIEKALWLYYAAQDPNTPAWAKTVIYGALAYFISPFDAIPDLTPVVGFADDLGAISAAVITVGMYITADVKAMADQKMKDWFGD